MSGIFSALYDLYIRLLVWLGAAPPAGYEHLLGLEAGPRQYTVKSGDTLYALARKFGVHYDLIAKANHLPTGDSLKPGQTLTIPSSDWQPPVLQPAAPPPIKPIVTEAPVPSTPSIPFEEEPDDDPELFWLDRETESEGDSEPPVAPPIEEPAPEEVMLPSLEAEPELEVEPEVEAEVAPPQIDPATAFRYSIQRGDTLNAIARHFGLTVTALIEANDIPDPNIIFPGQKLIIPGYLSPTPEPEPQPIPPPPPTGEYIIHPVMANETLSAIAKQYGVTVRQLVEANNIQNPDLIRVGQVLRIPRVSAPPEPLPEPIDPVFPRIGPANAIRALYVSYFAIGHAGFREHIFKLLETTEFNAVIIDAKGDHGFISYPTNNSTVHEIGAARPTAKDFDQVMARFKARKIYTIARLVTFKDTPFAQNFPEYAVRAAGGEIWQDGEELSWADPFLKPVWDYNVEIALEAARKGFDEVQFDYVRFPTPSQMGSPQFSQEMTKETRIAAITSFLSIAHGQLKPLGVKVAADTFGYTCWRKDDTQIGQDIDRMGQYLDVLCPMLYPSTFGSGIPGYKFAIAHPYEIVYESARRAVERMSQFGCEVRPWIQDFPDYRFDKRVYGRTEIQAQIKGCFDSGSSGFMVWDPRVRYTEGAYAPALAAASAASR